MAKMHENLEDLQLKIRETLETDRVQLLSDVSRLQVSSGLSGGSTRGRHYFAHCRNTRNSSISPAKESFLSVCLSVY